jgi:hypothetical protein
MASDLGAARWRKASRSNGTGGDCVEVAHLTNTAVGVRDSKNPAGPVLTMPVSTWDNLREATKGT